MTFQDPETLFHAALAAFEEEDWDGIAEMCDPASLSIFRSQIVRQYTRPRRVPPITVDDYLRQAPDMPREVAEYHLAQASARSNPEIQLEEDFPTVASVQELLGKTPAQLYAAWLDGRSARRQMQRVAAQRALAPSAVEQVLQRRAKERFAVLGVIPDGERVAHVIFRPEHEAVPDAGGSDPAEREFQRDTLNRRFINVVTCRRGSDGGWRLIADYAFFGHGATVFGWSEPVSGDAV